MGFSDVVSRMRAGSLRRSPAAQSPVLQPSDPEKAGVGHLDPSSTISEKALLEAQAGNGGSLVSKGSTHAASRDNPVTRHRATHHVVRTVPTWVQSLGDYDTDPTNPTLPLLQPGVPRVQIASHHFNVPQKSQGRSEPWADRLDHPEQTWRAWPSNETVGQHGSRWEAFMKASAYPATSSEEGEVVTEEWLVQNGADYSRPWLAGAEEEDVENARSFKVRRKVWWKRIRHTIIRSPLIPLVIRSIVWMFSAIALSLGAYLSKISGEEDTYTNDTSAIMAIVVDAVALLYLLYITYDEYTGKPLGLRSAGAKMRLIFLDLFFIVFDSANLSLAFQVAGDLCGRAESTTCKLQNALASVLLIALIAWLLTFAISVLR
ncbi:MAG: hypothetical protein Q9167_000091 [Letrouitia subvulpina]